MGSELSFPLSLDIIEPIIKYLQDIDNIKNLVLTCKYLRNVIFFMIKEITVPHYKILYINISFLSKFLRLKKLDNNIFIIPDKIFDYRKINKINEVNFSLKSSVFSDLNGNIKSIISSYIRNINKYLIRLICQYKNELFYIVIDHGHVIVNLFDNDELSSAKMIITDTINFLLRYKEKSNIKIEIASLRGPLCGDNRSIRIKYKPLIIMKNNLINFIKSELGNYNLKCISTGYILEESLNNIFKIIKLKNKNSCITDTKDLGKCFTRSHFEHSDFRENFFDFFYFLSRIRLTNFSDIIIDNIRINNILKSTQNL